MSLSAFGLSVDYIVEQLLGIPGFVLFLCFRGFCEAWTALKLGDNTAYLNGYLTMNPKKHINPIGFIFLIVFGFGFSNPVPTNSRNYKHIKRDNAIQILSAPLSGVVLMALACCPLSVLVYRVPLQPGHAAAPGFIFRIRIHDPACRRRKRRNVRRALQRAPVHSRTDSSGFNFSGCVFSAASARLRRIPPDCELSAVPVLFRALQNRKI